MFPNKPIPKHDDSRVNKRASASLFWGVGALGYVTCDLDPAELGQIRGKTPEMHGHLGL